MSEPGFVVLERGDPARDFTLPTQGQPRFALGSAAGRWLVLFFYGAGHLPGVEAALRAVAGAPEVFDDRRCAFFGVAANRAEFAPGGVATRFPTLRHFDDSARTAARADGAAPRGGGAELRPGWVVLAPDLRVPAP
ncbi:MAG: redoxin domain-containing protein, partial [Rhodobacteraceae bacterium]|nr:redoxin domain-containing protein [Paracoccaceae bacterium]